MRKNNPMGHHDTDPDDLAHWQKHIGEDMTPVGTFVLAGLCLLVGLTVGAGEPRAESPQHRSGKALVRKPLPTDLGQWWQARGNRRMTGRSSVKGNIKTPAILWKYPMAARQTLLAATFMKGGVEHPISLPNADIAASDWEQLLTEFGASAPRVDLDGDGSLSPLPRGSNSKAGHILAEQQGWQLVTTRPKNYPESKPYLGTVTLHIREKGEWVPKWETETDTLIWAAEPIFGDFDHDGRTEIACLPWYKMSILDAETGEIEEQCHFLHENENAGAGGRAYGWFGAYDVDNSGKDEFVVLDDFTKHMEVLAWKDRSLQRLWVKLLRPVAYRTNVPPREKEVSLRVNPEPVQDVDGDGKREIVVSTYNISEDQMWHVWVLDALTGEIRWDLPGMYLSGLRDVTGDGTPELFCTRVEKGLLVPDPSDLSLLSLQGGERKTLWARKNASFQTCNVAGFSPNVNSGASMGGETVLCGPVSPGGRSVFFTREPVDVGAGTVDLTAWQADQSQLFRSIGKLRGPRLDALGVRADDNDRHGVLVRASSFDGEESVASCFGSTATILLSRRAPAPVCPVVVGRLEPESSPTVLVQGVNETVEAIRPMPDGGAKRLWRAPGRGMTCNNYWEGLLLADVAGDGSVSPVVGTRGKGDCARLAVLSSKGETVWYRDFEEFPGTPPPWNVPGLMYWQSGYFNDTARMDLLIQMRLLGGMSYVMDGRNGKPLWERSQSVPGRMFGRYLMTLYDFDGDGLEDALQTYPDLFCVADGRTGDLRVAERAGKFVPGYGYDGSAIVADFLGNDQEQLLFSSANVMALLQRNGERIWHGSEGLGSVVRAGIGDADGGGKMDLFLITDSDGKLEFQCWEAATGQVKWTLPLPSGAPKPTDPATADLDGDGKEECVFTMGDTVYAVGAEEDGRSGKIEWTLTMPGHLSAVSIADVEGDGLAQIVVSCADGAVYGIGSAKKERKK